MTKIPAKQPITAEQSRASRFQLGLTQANVIEQSGLPGYKLKQFETGRFVPDMPFLQKLAEFYTSKGIDLSEAVPMPVDAVPTVPVKPGADMVRVMHRPGFYISDSVTPEVLDTCLERMHENDKRIEQLLATPLKTKLFGGEHSDETVAQHQELFGALGENYLIFLGLQGKTLVPLSEGVVSPKSHADLLSQFYGKSPIASTLAAGQPGQKNAPAPADEEEEEEEAQ